MPNNEYREVGGDIIRPNFAKMLATSITRLLLLEIALKQWLMPAVWTFLFFLRTVVTLCVCFSASKILAHC